MVPAPASPDRSDSATFSARAIALDDWTKNFGVSQMQEAVNSAYNNAVEAAASAIAAGAIPWVSGTTYAIGNVRSSLADAKPYRRKTTGAGTTDPSLDGANWVLVTLSTNSITRSPRTANTALIEQDRGSLIDITSGTFSQTFTAAATLGSGWYCYIRNSGLGVITLDPNAAELINGLSTVLLNPGVVVLVQSDVAGLNALVIGYVAEDHSVLLHTGNGLGSTNACIRRFTTVQSSTGTAITYADSATLGASFTINAPGLYAMTYTDKINAGSSVHGISKNTATPNGNITGNAAATRLGLTVAAPNLASALTIVALLAAGDVIRPHTNAGQDNASPEFSNFSIRKISP